METTLSSSSVDEQTPRFLQGNEINRIGLRIPEFTPADPELWFSIMDRSFQAAGITTDSTKFGYALTAIGPRYTLEVRDIIMNPPATNAYQTLRTVLEHEEIGDRKPSQFLRHLRGLAGSVVGDGVLRTIWLSRLPTHVQPHLVTRANDTIDQLADIADAIMEATRTPSPRVTEIVHNTTPSVNAQVNLQIAQMQLQQRELLEQINNLQKTIEKMQLSDRGRERRRSRSRSQSSNRGKSGVCWYHLTFGKTAQKCQPPCSAQKSENALTPP